MMELLEGETLADRLTHGPLPIDAGAQATRIEIADALSKATPGRDSPRSQAWQHHADEAGREAARLRSCASRCGRRAFLGVSLADAAAPLTQQGTCSGLSRYMSPEQLEGREADARADIFAFGAVLYEMVTGRRAFDGKTQASLVASIMSATPPADLVVQPMTPPSLERVVRVVSGEGSRRTMADGAGSRQPN